MKAKRLTLEEIKEQIILLDNKLSRAKKENEGGMISADFLISQIKQLENQIVQLQPMLANIDSGQAALLAGNGSFAGIGPISANGKYWLKIKKPAKWLV